MRPTLDPAPRPAVPAPALLLAALLSGLTACAGVGRGGSTRLDLGPASAATPESPGPSVSSGSPGSPPGAPVTADRVGATAALEAPTGSPTQEPTASHDARPEAPPARYENIYRRAGISVAGMLLGNFNTVLRVNSSTIVGTSLAVEDDLGIGKQDEIGRLDLYYAFNDRHRIDFAYYSIDRSSTRRIDRTIDIGDETFAINAQVNSFLNTDIYKLAYRYNFVADDRTSIGASLGFHTMDIALGVSEGSTAKSVEASSLVPLPVIGLHSAYALSRRWTMRGSIEFMQVRFDGAGGFVSDLVLALDHDLTDHLGWGLAYNGFRLDAEYPDGSLTAELDYSYQGLMLYLRAFL